MMKEITDKMIEIIKNENFSAEIFYLQIGYAANPKIDEISESEFIYSFYEQGKYLWDKYKGDIRRLLCDLEKGEPKNLVGELINGDIRATLEAIIPVIAAQLSLPLGIAIPIACLVLKLKLKAFCSLEWKG